VKISYNALGSRDSPRALCANEKKLATFKLGSAVFLSSSPSPAFFFFVTLTRVRLNERRRRRRHRDVSPQQTATTTKTATGGKRRGTREAN